jgi:hypothetical protein
MPEQDPGQARLREIVAEDEALSDVILGADSFHPVMTIAASRDRGADLRGRAGARVAARRPAIPVTKL